MNAKITILAVFVLTLCAGAVAGFLVARFQTAPTPVQTTNSSLAEELELSPEQRTKMQAIWEGVRDLADKSFASSKNLQDQRNEAIRKLISPDKMPQYDDIMRQYQDDNADLDGRRRAAFDQAVKKTKEILSPAQQVKYDQILAKRLGSEGTGQQMVGKAQPSL